MSNALINFYHNLEEPIIVYDKKQNVLYHNLSFKKIFGDFNSSSGFECLSKLSYKFSPCIFQREMVYCAPWHLGV